MKVLFISERILWKSTGAEKVSNNLLSSLNDIIGEDNIEIISFTKENIKNTDKFKNIEIYKMHKSIIKKLENKLRLNIGGITPENRIKILNKIESENYDYIFLDSSEYGKLSKEIKMKYPSIKVIVFFHDVSKFLLRSLINSSKSIKEKLKLYIQYPAYIYNEKKSIDNADILITLNERDSKLIEQEYGVTVLNHIPVTIKDSYKKYIDTQKNESDINLLFVGAYYLPNVKGIKWFVKEVLPSIDARLTIVGNGMEVLKSELESETVEILGFVDDLGEVYHKSSCVIAPIFDGGGMKVKIAEALMHGKIIFGTTEAFEGYDLELGKMGEKCDNAQEFIENINRYINLSRMEKFNEHSRRIFLDKYDYQVSIKKMREILNK